MKRIIIEDGTRWPNPNDDYHHEIAWKLRFDPKSLSHNDFLHAANILDAYEDIISHPAFTLKVVNGKISQIRKAIKAK